jgi:hypothetical protein
MNLDEKDHQYEERKTPEGFLVKVRLSKMTYVVFTPKGPEVPKGAKNNSIIVPVPRVVFLGEDFNLSHFRMGDLSFVNVKNGKLMIPYQHGGAREIKTINLNSGSESDILPVIIYHFANVKDLSSLTEKNIEFQHIVADEGLQRNDMVSLKIRYPYMNIFLLKKISIDPILIIYPLLLLRRHHKYRYGAIPQDAPPPSHPFVFVAKVP